MRLLQVFLFVLCVTCVLSWGRSIQARDTTKPTLTCPPNIDTVADPIQVNTKVTWTEPKAYDNGEITPKRTGPKPGLLFSGSTKITYSAIDKSSNYATCSFWINVRVITCRRWTSVSNGWKKCHPSVQMRYGGRCDFGCYDGHELVGPTRTNCLESGNWDVATQPFCQKLTCPRLLPSHDQASFVIIQCSDTNYYRSQCTYVCAEGYNVLPGKNRLRVCGATGNWVGDEPICVDSKIPDYTNCPHVKTAYAERSKTRGRVWWDTPLATDNSGSVTVTQTYGPVSGTDLLVGEYDVIYKALDDAGNLALCEFQIIIKQISCHTIYPLPYTSVLCPNGKIYGSSCTFACKSNNTAMNGASYAECDKTGTNIQYGYWTFGDHQPYCELTSSCSELTPPINGALACDTWAAGRYCQMFCQEGYVALDNTDIHMNLQVCGDSGDWLGSLDGTIEFPDCQEIDRPFKESFILNLNIYYEGPCSDDNTAIKVAFLEVITRTFGQCKPPDCVVDNVNVICGAIAKRSADDHNVLDRYKRSQFDITISVNFVVSKDTTGVKEPLQQKFEYEKSLKESVANGSFIIIVDGESYEYTRFGMSLTQEQCDEGSALDHVSLQCEPIFVLTVYCSIGHYHNTTNQTCVHCPRGYYQDKSKQTSCKQCPIGMTTESTGASNLSLCLDACAPGYFSTLGTTPCSPCDLGYYTGKNGTTECTVCPGSKITLTSGAVYEDQCQDFDVKYTVLDEGETIVPATVTVTTDDIPDQLYLSIWVRCTQCDNIVTITNIDGEHILYIAQQQQYEIKTLMGSTEYPSEIDLTNKDTWTNIQLQWTSTTTTILIGEQETVSENNTLPLSNFVSNQVNVTIGGIGFIGSVSQLNIWKSSTSDIDTASTQCSPKVHGDWLAWKRFAETDGSFVFTNSKCDDFDNCESTPCLNDGTCSDALDGFTCVCKNGFTGSICDVNIDDCQGISPCDNEGVCDDGDNDYTCLCKEGFSGDFCEIKVVDGNWATWDDWSACSVSCGYGSQSRSRVCDDPAPDNGGLDCEGDSQETQECIIEKCEINECLHDPPAIKNGDLNCVWVDSDNDTRACSPTCHDGYDFDSVTYIQDTEIICGSNTSFVWNIENNTLPSCTKKQKATTNKLNITAKYLNIHELTEDVTTNIIDVVSINIADQGCLKTGDCSTEGIDVYLSDAIDDGLDGATRRKRAASTVSFTMHLSCDLSSTSDIEDCYNFLADIVTVLDTLIEQLGLTINKGGTDYNAGLNTSSLSGISLCADGYVPVYEYCIPCGEGMYQDDIYCQRCDVGYYQDTQGQRLCKQCTMGWTTSGLQSKHVSYCNIPVALPLSSDPEDATNTILIIIIVVVLVGAALIGLAILIAYLVWKKNPKARARTVTPTGSCGDVLELDKLGVGNRNKKFDGRYLQPSSGNEMFRRDMVDTPVIDNKEGQHVSTGNPMTQVKAVTPTDLLEESPELDRLGVGNINTKFDGRYLHQSRGNDMFRRDIFNAPDLDNKEGPQVSTINVAPWGNIDKESDSGNI